MSDSSSYLRMACGKAFVHVSFFLGYLLNFIFWHIYLFFLIQDDTAFEKQSALFALAISDIVLINMWDTLLICSIDFPLCSFWSFSSHTYYWLSIITMCMSRWCHDIGREQAANKPLLKTVFQVPRFNLFVLSGLPLLTDSHDHLIYL